jgi:flavorubredoxin
MLPTAAAFLTYLKGLAPKNRAGMAFGSYGWSGQSPSQAEEVLKSMGFVILDQARIQYVPAGDQLAEVTAKLEQGIESLKE